MQTSVFPNDNNLYLNDYVMQTYQQAIAKNYGDLPQATCVEVDKGYILPIKKAIEDNGTDFFKGGVADENHRFVSESCFYRAWKSGSLLDGYDFDDHKANYIDKEVIYAGILFNHFGHFLVEGTSRLWYLVENASANLDIAFVTPKDKKIFPQFWEFMELLGIDKKRVHIIKEITRFKKIYVPNQAHIMTKSYNDKFTLPFRYISQRIGTDIIPQDKIYFSRTKFKNRYICLGEKPIEKLFQQNGYKIVYPEQLSLKEQILCWLKASEVAGLEGTALHMALFAPHHLKITMLERSDNFVPEQVVINQAINAESYWISVNINPFPTDHSAGPALLAITPELKNFMLQHHFKFTPEQIGKVSKKDCHRFLKCYLQMYSREDKNKLLQKVAPITAQRLNYMSQAFISFGKELKQNISHILNKTKLFFKTKKQ